MALLLSITSLLISIYDYKIDVMMNSNYLKISDEERELSNMDNIEIISCDDNGTCIVRVSLEEYEDFMSYLNKEEFGYVGFDNSDEILYYVKIKPIVKIAAILCLIFELLIPLVIIWRKFKKEEIMRTNLNNIGANRITLIKLDSVYVWVFICYALLCSVFISIFLSIFKFSGYLSNNLKYVYSSIGIIHVSLIILYFLLLCISIAKIKKKK